MLAFYQTNQCCLRIFEKFLGDFEDMRKVMKKSYLSLLFLTTMSLTLGACKTTGGYTGQSSLKGIYDDTHILRMTSISGFGVYKFEVCLSAGFGRAQPNTCVSALKTNTGEDLLLTVDMIEGMYLAPQQKQHLLERHDEYTKYQQALSNTARNLGAGAGATGGIVLGGSGGVYGLHRMKQGATRKLAEVNQAIVDQQKNMSVSQGQKNLADSDRLEEIKKLISQTQDDQKTLTQLSEESATELAKLKGLEEELAKQKAVVSKFDGVQSRLGLASFDEVSQNMVDITSKLKAAGLSVDAPPQALISASELAGRKTLVTDKFIAFVIEDVGAEFTDDIREAMTVSFGMNPDKIDPELFKKFKAAGGKLDEIVEPAFLDKVFAYNKIENALLGKGLNQQFARPENMEQLAKAFEAGDFRFLKSSLEFVQSGGVSPTASSLYTKLQSYKAVMPKNKLLLTQLESQVKESLDRRVALDDKAKALEESIQKRLAQGGEDLAGVSKTRGAEFVRQGEDALGKLVKEADSLARKIKFAPKGVAGVVVAGVAAAAGVVGITTKTYMEPRQNVKGVMDQYDELEVLLGSSSPLFTSDPSYNAPVNSVEAILYNFAVWQSQEWVDTQNTGIVVREVCLPKSGFVVLNTPAAETSVNAECKVLNAASSVRAPMSSPS